MNQCIRCDNKAENTFRFVVVNKNVVSRSIDNYVVIKKQTVDITEKLVSVERTCICNKCIQKERNKLALEVCGFAVLFMVGLLVRTRSHFGWETLLVSGGLAIIIATCAIIYSRVRKDAFYAVDIRKETTSDDYYFVPVDATLYCSKDEDVPNLNKFIAKTGLRTELANAVFEKFVLPGHGDAMIDSMIDFPQTEPIGEIGINNSF